MVVLQIAGVYVQNWASLSFSMSKMCSPSGLCATHEFRLWAQEYDYVVNGEIKVLQNRSRQLL